jgi:hypothetical protein
MKSSLRPKSIMELAILLCCVAGIGMLVVSTYCFSTQLIFITGPYNAIDSGILSAVFFAIALGIKKIEVDLLKGKILLEQAKHK